MAILQAVAERQVPHSPAAVYAAIADYQGLRQRIMPPAYQNMQAQVEPAVAQSVFSFELHVGNHRRPYRMRVSDAVPNETLVERDENSSFATEWRISPIGVGCHVLLRSTWQQRVGGVAGLFERLFAPRSLAKLHADTLRRLEQELGATVIAGAPKAS